MFSTKLHKNENGQAALETAIILIAFVVVASVFAFAILSAGSASTERGEQAIYSGLEGVQSSMEVKGAVIAQGASGNVNTVVFTIAPVNGGQPINLGKDAALGTTGDVVISYRDATNIVNSIPFTVNWIRYNEGTAVTDADALLEEGELAQITVDLTGLTPTKLAANTAFTLEIKPPTGGVIQINRTTPAAIEAVMELR